MSESGVMVRNSKGQFVKGKSGNALGRPKGSKNQITTAKLMVEEAFRADSSLDIAEVLKKIVKQALDGDKASQKLVWDSAVSKQTLAEDKAAGSKQQINVKTMHVVRDAIEGEFDDITEDNEEETLQ